MKRQGIPRPLFRIEDKLAKAVAGRYRKILRRLLKSLRDKLRARGLVTDAAESDSFDDLMAFFEEMGERLREENAEISRRADILPVVKTLEEEWADEDREELERLDDLYTGEIGDDFRAKVSEILRENQEDFLKRLFDDSDGRMRGAILSFSVDKRKFFEEHLEEVRALYLDNSMQRIAGEQDLLKKRILERITDYAMGRSDELDIVDLARQAYEGGDKLSRFFARDQIQRFNKACTLSTFKSAGVTKVKWVTSNDGRVRDKGYKDKAGRWHRAHTELQGQVFSVNALPIEVDDYNCRCGLVPVEWEE